MNDTVLRPSNKLKLFSKLQHKFWKQEGLIYANSFSREDEENEDEEEENDFFTKSEYRG
jgi:hypothetical protein